MFGLLAVAKYTPLGAYFSMEKIQELVKSAGWFGLFVFFGIFLLGTLMNLPGAVFLVFAILTWGYFQGILISYFSAVMTATINFWFARFIGGKALTEIKNKRIKKVLHRIETNPITTICWLRVFMLLSPVINYTLALTNIKTRQFLIGNAIAMVFPFILIILTTILFRSAYFQEIIATWF